MIALDLIRQHWTWGMLAIGLVMCWALYQAHYGAPEPPRREEAGVHEFPDGLIEGSLPVPLVMKLFLVLMFVLALAYVAWVRLVAGSY